MKPLALLAAVLLLSGCSTKVWYQPGKTAADAQRDFGACRMQSAQAPATTTRNMSGLGAFMSSQIASGNFLDACMLEKGYQRVPAKTISNGGSYPK